MWHNAEKTQKGDLLISVLIARKQCGPARDANPRTVVEQIVRSLSIYVAVNGIDRFISQISKSNKTL